MGMLIVDRYLFINQYLTKYIFWPDDEEKWVDDKKLWKFIMKGTWMSNQECNLLLDSYQYLEKSSLQSVNTTHDSLLLDGAGCLPPELPHRCWRLESKHSRAHGVSGWVLASLQQLPEDLVQIFMGANKSNNSPRQPGVILWPLVVC